MIIMVVRHKMLWNARCRCFLGWKFFCCADVDPRQSLIQNLVKLSQTAPSVHIDIPPEVTNYVESSRNPDIYTREFVELVQRTNQMLKGREEAYRFLQEQIAWQLSNAVPELRDDVVKVVEATGGKVLTWSQKQNSSLADRDHQTYSIIGERPSKVEDPPSSPISGSNTAFDFPVFVREGGPRPTHAAHSSSSAYHPRKRHHVS